MSLLGPRIPVTIYLYREDPGITLEAARRRSTPALSKRRSVSSMKGLLPLSLPSTRSSSSSTKKLAMEDSTEDKIDDCLPELLARDLELSSAVFAAKNMTSGAPSPSLLFEDEPKFLTMSSLTRVPTSPYQTSSARIRTLDPIEERDSMVSFLDRRDVDSNELPSDVESISGTDSSDGVEPVSIRLREHSIVTTATSLTSTCESAPSPVETGPRRTSREHSWVDMDTEDEEMEELIEDETPVALSPRPSTPPDAYAMPGFTEGSMERPRTRQSLRSNHRNQSSQDSSRGTLPKRQLSVMSATDVSTRRPRCTLVTTDDIKMQERRHRSQSPNMDRKTSLKKPRRTVRFPLENDFAENDAPVSSHKIQENDCSSVKDDGNSLGTDDEDILDTDLPAWLQPDSVFIQPSPPPSPLPTVQAWLDGANQPYNSHSPIDDMAKAVPLPPDVIETLRVSIACFPETMLLSSSLTIETIRSYSRKIKHIPKDLGPNTLADAHPHNSRRSIWRRAVSHSRESISMRLHWAHQSYENESEVPIADSLEPVNLWAPLRNVFMHCSDYICDALYAHIVAYNYICRIPRSQTPIHSKRASMASSHKSQKDEIPKKAATLLGLHTGSESAPASAGRLARKLGGPLTSWGFGRDHMESTPTTYAQDAAIKNIQTGLLRCITRLIATARMMSEEGTGEYRFVEADVKEVDVVLTRSLCEIVRISEEAA